ncbi:hypothetical protein [Chlorobium sp. N1]|uniref:hypothetical protein n=1 Tax=Chlorobium sp. N1 TaxID=2491138 RepID=UPI00103CBC51|nr:hypothetical protein [Chlorobium sp. N1]TCD48018.1 hypothetical protein E0L29_03750 [Chlorobium sp. N1]
MKYRFVQRVAGLLAIVCSLLILVAYSDVVAFSVRFAEAHLSVDHKLEAGGINAVRQAVAGMAAMLCLGGIVVLTPLPSLMAGVLRKFVDTRALRAFLSGDDFLSDGAAGVLFVFATVPAVAMHLFVLALGEPSHEGMLENLSSFGFLIAGATAWASCAVLGRHPSASGVHGRLRLFLFLLGLVFVVLFGEEMSWGQRFFGWESSGVFAEYNYQHETTLHNFFNPLFVYLYPMVGMSAAAVAFALWLFPARPSSLLLRLLLPPPSFALLLFVMAASSFRGHSEVFEELLALFSMLYAARLFMILRGGKAVSALLQPG